MESSPTRRRSHATFLWALRIASTLAAVAYLLQAVSAGQFLDGDYGFLRLHQLGTTLADALMLLVLLSAGGLRWIARGPLAPFLVTVGALVLSQAQAATGATRIIWLHVPLGVVLIGLVWALAWGTWAWATWQGTTE